LWAWVTWSMYNAVKPRLYTRCGGDFAAQKMRERFAIRLNSQEKARVRQEINSHHI